MSQASPPVLDYDVDALEPPGWPKRLGITSIVFGALMVGCAGCGVIGFVFQKSMIPPEQAANMPPSQMTPESMIHMAAGTANDILLIIAGSMTLARKNLGRYLHLFYASLAIVLAAIAVWLLFKQQAATQQWAAQNPDNPTAKAMSGPMGQIGLIIGLAMITLLGFGYPLFILVWFGLVKRTHESMTGGVERPMPAA